MKAIRTRSQTRRIVDYLATGKGLTPLVALRRFSCLRLSGRIHELRGQGHDIRTRIVKRGATHVAEYRLAH